MDGDKLLAVATDDEALAEAICLPLREAGYEVERWTETSGGADQVTLLLCDRRLQEMVIPPSDLPVIMFGERHHITTALADGADDYLTTPFDPDELLARVRASLRRRANLRLQRGLPDHCQDIIDQLPEGILVTEAPSGHIVAANRAAAMLMGGNLRVPGSLHEYAAVKRFREDGTPMDVAELPIERALRDGQPHMGARYVIETPDGRRVPVLANAAPLRDKQGQVTGVVGVWQDITALKETDELKREFLAMVTNELHSPLATIKSCASALLHSHRPIDDEHSMELLQAIDEQADSLADKVSDLIEMSRIEAGTLQIRRRLTFLEPILQRTIAEYRRQIPRRHFDLSVPNDLPPVLVDSRRIRQVVHNLIDNAAHFSASGEPIRIHVQTVSAAEAMDRWAVVGVSDTGEGIDKQYLERIFDKFYSIGNATASHSGGGLGLAICRAIVEAHGGRIWAESTVGEGSTFFFTLPLTAAAAGGALADTPSKRTPRGAEMAGVTFPPDDPAKILVIDDDEQVVRFLRITLERAGHSVLSTCDPLTALAMVDREQPDLILLDLILPGSDGFELCARIREFSQAPIVMLSGMDGEADKVRGLDLGADDYLTKPFHPQELLARVRAVLRRAAPPEDRERHNPLVIGDLVIDFNSRAVTLAGREVQLTGVEYRLLHHLALNAGQVVTHEELLEQVWGPEYRSHFQYLWVHIRHLRAKIEAEPSRPKYLLTEHGIGYHLALPR